MELNPARAQPWPDESVQQCRDRRTGIHARASLAKGQEKSSRRPAMLGILAADSGKKMIKDFKHVQFIDGSFAGSGMGTLVTFRLASRKSTKKSAQSSGLKSLAAKAR